MLRIVSGNLLEASVEALVNTVNTVGVMGKGIALQVKQAFPEVFREYERAARKGEIKIGRVQVVPTNRLDGPRFVINFPTKRHWRGKSRIADIEAGLVDLARVAKELDIKSMAVPPLGCGNGGLKWEDVRPRIVRALEGLSTDVVLYQPSGAPQPEAMPVGTARPRMTPLRAALIKLVNDYAVPGYRLTLLELQKLAYFWEISGKPSGLDFVKERYGPYSEKLNFALQRLEGHYIRGYGDRSRDSSVALIDGALDEALRAFSRHDDELDRVNRVSDLISGFETPYGMELLATVHWLMTHDDGSASDPAKAEQGVYGWNARKRQLFKPEHIRLAWRRLTESGWVLKAPTSGLSAM